MLTEEPLENFAASSGKLTRAQREIHRLSGGCDRMISSIVGGLKQASGALKKGNAEEAQIIIEQMLSALSSSSETVPRVN